MNLSKRRRAFTLVELVIVIAVIGILAAVLIPTFATVIKNANIAKDKATCRNMNEILAVSTVDQVHTVANIIAFAEEDPNAKIIAVRDILKAGGVSEENFKAATDGYLFLYYPEDNVMLLAEGREAIVFPETYTTAATIDLSMLADLDPAGDPVIPHEHEYDTNRVVVPATCTEKGSVSSTCSVCGKSYYEEIEALGHDYQVKNVVAPTCTTQGYTVYECSRCHDTYNGDETEVVAHTAAEAVRENEVAATCTATGSYDEVVYCSECHAEISRTPQTSPIDPVAHSFTNFEYDNNQACEVNGTKTATCDHGCGATKTVDDDAHTALGHSFTNYVSNDDATCTADGTETATCDRCDATDTRTVENSALGHDYTKYVPSETEVNKHDVVCSRCDNKEKTEDCDFENATCKQCGAKQKLSITWDDTTYDVTMDGNGVATGVTVEYGTNHTFKVTREGYTVTTVNGVSVNASGEVTLTITADTVLTIEAEEAVNNVEYTVNFKDTWNDETTSGTITLAETTSITAAQVASIAPDGWVASTDSATVNTETNAVTFNGERHREIDSADYTVITTETGLYHMSGVTSGVASDDAARNALSKNYVLDNNIALTSEWYPLGRAENTNIIFSGILDGAGNTISGLNMDYEFNNVGLFGYTAGTIRNLNINATKVAGYLCVGVVAGRAVGGTISNVHVTVSEQVRSYSNSDSWSSVGISRASAIGGIVGLMDNSAKVSLCSFKGTVNGYAFSNNRQSGGSVGGICGLMLLGTIEKSWYEGSLNSAWNSGYAGNNIGGIAGAALSTSIIENCHAYVDYINGYDWEGGIVGNASSTVQLKYCWAFVVNGGTYYGNYIGEICPSSLNSTVTDCYYSPDSCIAGGKGTSTSTLGNGGTLTGFDTSIWAFDANWPYLIENV